MKVVITGSLGRVGRRLMAALPGSIGVDRGEGADVVVDFDTVDYDADPMRGVLASADAVVHLASDPNNAAPDAVQWQSVVNSARLFAAAEKAGVRCMVVASSGWAVPMPGQWENAYSHSKRVMEVLAAMYDLAPGRRGRAVRIGWVPDDPSDVPGSPDWVNALYWDDARVIAEFRAALGLS